MAKLPARCVVLGSWSLFLWLLSCKFLWGAVWVNPLAQWFTWEGAPCQVGTSSVKLAGLSSKSTCNSLLHLEFRVHFWLVYSCVQFAVPADWEAPGWFLNSNR